MMVIQKCLSQRLRRMDAFTLIEVLVVTALTGLIAAVLIPVFLSAREKSRQSVCAANLSQLYKAVALYSQDNEGFRPMYNVGAMPVRLDGQDILWPDQSADLVRCLQPYGASPALWFCPDDPVHGQTQGGKPHPVTSYACQTSFYTPVSGPPLPVPIVPVGREPAQIFLFEDAICLPGADPKTYLYTHNQWYNIVYCDGHVRAKSVNESIGKLGCYST